jgi:S1-C subfamily serine protease
MLRNARAAKPEDVALIGATADILIDRLAPQQAISMLDEWLAKGGINEDIYRLRARADEAMRRTGAAQRWKRAEPSKPLPADMSAMTTAWPAPYFQPLDGAGTVAAGNGVVIDEGRYVLTHARVVESSGTQIRVRNGLGQVRQARLDKVDRPSQLALLRLLQPYPQNASLRTDRIGPAGVTRFCFVLGFPMARSVDGAYPASVPGLIFRADIGVGHLMQITSSLGVDHIGSPVFDPAGRLLGIAVGNQDSVAAARGSDNDLGAGNFAIRVDSSAAALLTPKKSVSPIDQSERVSVASAEELYERLAPAVVQILVTR